MGFGFGNRLINNKNMDMNELVVLFIGALGIIFTYWFFLGKKPSFAEATGGRGVDVIVEGGYSP